MSQQCTHAGCIAIAEPQAGPEAGLCARHRQAARVRRGACLNCGGALVATAELNTLTGRPLVRNGRTVYNHACAAGCGYARRDRTPRTKGRLR